MRKRSRAFLTVVGFLICLWPGGRGAVADSGQELAASLPPEVMQEAIQGALQLRFEQAHESLVQPEPQNQEALDTLLTRGIIAYLQTRWQTRQRPPAHTAARKHFTEIVRQAERQLANTPHQGRLQLLAGLAAVFDALLPEHETPWAPLQLAAHGRALLEQALMSGEDLNDAHLGLGMLYFVGEELPALGRRLLPEDALVGSEEAVRHFRLAVEGGQFGRDLARTFLLRLYVAERRYGDAVSLGESLRQAYPGNGYVALHTGLSQFENGDVTGAAETLGALAEVLAARPQSLAKPNDRFELFYTWGRALLDTGRGEAAFDAFREAINYDPGADRDETLWAKFHLATLYEQRGQDETARQMFCSLLRGRDADGLLRRAESRLGSRRCR